MASPAYVHPLQLGALRLENNLCLAPMAGYTNLAMRLITKEVGNPGLVAAEMVAALPVETRPRDTRWHAATATDPRERPVAMQVYGRDPELCALAAGDLEAAGADAVDLNCGCQVRKARSAGCGVALMREPRQVQSIVRAMRRVLRVPLLVKMRLGQDPQHRTALEVARVAVEEGADALAIHARTGESKHGSPVDLQELAAVREAVPVPVLASGSLHTAAAIRRARDLTGIDGYQIGRAACGNPWIFRDLQAELRGEPPPPRPTLQERRRLLERHLELVLEVHGEALGVRLMRKYTFFYCQGLPGVRRFRDRFVRMESRAGFLNLMEEFFEAQGQRSPGEGVHPLSGGGRRP